MTNVVNYKAGDAVKILKIPDKYFGVLKVGDIGNVKCVVKYQGIVRLVHIIIPNKKNKYTGDGHFCVNPYHLEYIGIDVDSVYPKLVKINEIDTDEWRKILNARYGKGAFMKQELLKGYEIATVRFRDFKGEYKDVQYALYDTGIVPDDSVLCAKGHHGEVVGTVIKIEPYKDDVVEFGRQIICKIDYSGYKERLKKVERIKELKLKMAKKKEELNELAVYQALAATSPEMAEMLNELKELV